MRIDVRKLIVFMYEQDKNVNALAAAAGISRATVTAVKSGKSCSYQTAFKIAKALDVDVTELLED